MPCHLSTPRAEPRSLASVSLPSSLPPNRWKFLAFRLILAALVVYLLVADNQQYFFHTPLAETGDPAANSLSVLRAEHNAQLYGPYSRWGFDHPGPALFYSEALGEKTLYQSLHLTPAPFNAQVLVVLGLLASFFAAGVGVAARWVRGGVFIVLALLLAALHFTAVGGSFLLLGTWSAYVIPLIFFCLLLAAASVAAGEGADLPLLVLAGGFLVHLHVAQPLFVGPMFLLAYVGLWWSCWRRGRQAADPAIVPVNLSKGNDPTAPTPVAAIPQKVSRLPWRVFRRSHWLAILLAFFFVLPILVDLIFPHGNFHRILEHLRTHKGERHTFNDSLDYFLHFATYYPSLPYAKGTFEGAATLKASQDFLLHHPRTLLLWLGALLSPLLPLAARLWRGKEPVLLGDVAGSTATPEDYVSPAGRWRFLGWLWLVWIVSVGLTLYWGTIQDGEMFYFNAWFDYSIWLVLALLAAGSVADALDAALFRSERAGLWKTGAILACLGLTAAVLVRHPERFHAGDGAEEWAQVQQRAVAEAFTTEPAGTARAKLLVFPADYWENATGIAVQLTRAGRPAYVLPDWEFMFGAGHGFPNWEGLLSQPAETNLDFEVWHVVSNKGAAGNDAARPLMMLDAALVPNGLPIDPAKDAAIRWQGDAVNAPDFTGQGWVGPDTFTSRKDAVVQFRPVPVPADATVRITFDFVEFPFKNRHASERMELRFNGNDLGTLTFTEGAAEPQHVTVPAALWNRYQAVLLTMKFPDAVSLHDTGEAGDMRPFAVDARQMAFSLEAGAEKAIPVATLPTPTPESPAATPELSPSPVPEATPTPEPMVTPEPTATPEFSLTPTETPVVTPAEPLPTPATEMPTETPAPSPAPEPTANLEPTVSPAVSPTPADATETPPPESTPDASA